MTKLTAPLYRLIVAAALGALVAGCFAESYGTAGMKIWNQTSEAIDVIYRRPVGGVETDDVVTRVAPNQRVVVIGLHQTEGAACLRGTVIALHGERVVASIGQPCEGVEWVVADGPPASPPP